jgi:hypothetical protein
MPGFSWEITEHTLNIKTGSESVKQGLLCFNQEKHRAMGKELSRLLVIGFIKEIQHPNWIANLVLMPKKNEKNEDVC